MRMKATTRTLDQMKRQISLSGRPERIISLVPSQTELLFHLGLADRMVGVTKFCIHPNDAKKKETIGGTKKFNFEKIRALRPDLIIGNKEENYLDGIETLAREFPVWMSDIYTLEDALQMIDRLGQLLSCEEQAGRLVRRINEAFDVFSAVRRGRALYLIWRNPYMAVGFHTFIDDMLKRGGFQNAAEDFERYPELTLPQMQELQPDYLLLSSEPYPFKEKHIAELNEHFPTAKIILVNGEYFSWYGPRLSDAPAYFQALSAD